MTHKDLQDTTQENYIFYHVTLEYTQVVMCVKSRTKLKTLHEWNNHH